MRISVILLILLNFSIAKDIKSKIKNSVPGNFISLNGNNSMSDAINNLRSSRNDTSTVWLEDFEGDVSGWEAESEWELTTESSSSPSHSMRFDDDYINAYSSMISPLISLPEINDPEAEVLKMNFDLWCDLPDWFGDTATVDNQLVTYLGDYFVVDIANMSENPVYFSPSSTDSWDGESWWCANDGGYEDAWMQALSSPEVLIPDGATLSAMMQWSIESPNGASVAGTCTDGWDAANVRISTDGGATWNLLNGDDPYDFYYGYGWLYNDTEYDCGGSLEQLAAGWAGQADWHEVTFDLSAYAGQNAIIQFAFGSDPAYSTGDDASITGFKVDDILIAGSDGTVAFSDNADDQVLMVPSNLGGTQWIRYAVSYGDLDRPGSLGWETYPEGASYNVDQEFINLNISQFAGSDIHIRFVGITDDNDYTDETETVTANGSGLYIDDVHVWKVDLNVVPEVANLQAVTNDAQVLVSWDLPAGGSYDNDEISYNDGTFEDAIGLSPTSTGTAVMGNEFEMPYGVESFVANSCAIWGYPESSGETTLKAFSFLAGTPGSQPDYTLNVTLVENQWNVFDLNWEFQNSFILGIDVSSTISLALDVNNITSQKSWSNLAGWETWYQIVEDDQNSSEPIGLPFGVFGLNASVTTSGEAALPSFNVYRSVNDSEFNIMFNGASLNENNYTDNTVQFGNEYCYQVTAIYSGDEGAPAGPACVTPEAQTIYEIAHDDGEPETSIDALYQFGYLCVKFTPEAYPVDLYRANFYCDGAASGVAFVNVWDDDGENGMPGTFLVEDKPVSFAGGGWTPVSLSDENVVISDGSFYVGWKSSGQNPPVGVDADNPPDNSFIDLGYGLEPFGNSFYGAMMIRAEVDSVNVLSSDNHLDFGVPVSFSLDQNYPNPFNPSTTISFSLLEGGATNISMYDISGRMVKNLVSQKLSSGNHSIKLNASNLPSGMYFYSIMVSGSGGESLFSSTKKMVLMK